MDGNKPLDLKKIRAALTNLDQIAEEHPELIGELGQWDEKQVEEIMGTPANIRMKQSRERRKMAGLKQITVMLSPDAQAALDALRADGTTIDEVVRLALLNSLESKKAVDTEDG